MNANLSEETVIDVFELADRLKVSSGTARKWLVDGKIEGVQLAGNRWRTSEKWIAEFLEKHSNRPTDEPPHS